MPDPTQQDRSTLERVAYHGASHPVDVMRELRARFAPFALYGHALRGVHQLNASGGLYHDTGDDIDYEFALALEQFGADLDHAASAVTAWYEAVRKDGAA